MNSKIISLKKALYTNWPFLRKVLIFYTHPYSTVLIFVRNIFFGS
jgi:hypothetical protein